MTQKQTTRLIRFCRLGLSLTQFIDRGAASLGGRRLTRWISHFFFDKHKKTKRNTLYPGMLLESLRRDVITTSTPFAFCSSSDSQPFLRSSLFGTFHFCLLVWMVNCRKVVGVRCELEGVA